MLPAGVIVSIVGLLIGLYQWRRSRGDVRILLTEIQATIHVTVRADTPSPIKVHGIAYQVHSGRVSPLRFLRTFQQMGKDEPVSLLQRLGFAWGFHRFIAMGW